jgi:hypothetical protein
VRFLHLCRSWPFLNHRNLGVREEIYLREGDVKSEIKCCQQFLTLKKGLMLLFRTSSVCFKHSPHGPLMQICH